jgi:hypothetical protein
LIVRKPIEHEQAVPTLSNRTRKERLLQRFASLKPPSQEFCHNL